MEKDFLEVLLHQVNYLVDTGFWSAGQTGCITTLVPPVLIQKWYFSYADAIIQICAVLPSTKPQQTSANVLCQWWVFE